MFRRRKQKEEGIAASRARRERDQREREAVQKRNEAAAREAIREQQVHEHYQKRCALRYRPTQLLREVEMRRRVCVREGAC